MPKYIVLDLDEGEFERIDGRNVIDAVKNFHNERISPGDMDQHNYAVTKASEVTFIEASPISTHQFLVVSD